MQSGETFSRKTKPFARIGSVNIFSQRPKGDSTTKTQGNHIICVSDVMAFVSKNYQNYAYMLQNLKEYVDLFFKFMDACIVLILMNLNDCLAYWILTFGISLTLNLVNGFLPPPWTSALGEPYTSSNLLLDVEVALWHHHPSMNICKVCNETLVEDEYHLLLACSAYIVICWKYDDILDRHDN